MLGSTIHAHFAKLLDPACLFHHCLNILQLWDKTDGALSQPSNGLTKCTISFVPQLLNITIGVGASRQQYEEIYTLVVEVLLND